MERYSRVSSSKWQSIYSEEFKRFVCNDYLTGSITKSEVESKHHLGNGRLTYWLREMGFGHLKSRIVSLPDMKFDKNTASKKESQKSITELEQELQEAKFLAEAYRKMIEIAEKEFKINIVKKSNTK
jgi:transposase-like protein